MIIVSPRKDMQKLKMIYFPNRSEQQIKNRIKNSCGNNKEVANPIKDLKVKEVFPLSESEIEALKVAYARFGPRWPVISKYYQLRTPEFL
jgi:hypothetical protein